MSGAPPPERPDPPNPTDAPDSQSKLTGESAARPSLPRAFAQGTGVVLQTVGMILFLSTCCVCSLTSLWDPGASRGETVENFRRGGPGLVTLRTLPQTPAQTGYMLLVMFTTVGGLALASFGLGLQAERRRSAWGALATTGVMLASLLAGGVALWAGGAPWAVRAWHAGLLLVVAALAGFCAAALRQVMADPPPPDVDVVPPGAKIPYSFYHDDPPEVRLARDLAARRAKLDAERDEIDRMERELQDREGQP